ncbi:MAG: DMT family transporter [Alphaproteobacteria bacterium]|nr:DMT family transporter [Alphaproteobacteria bacterium]
MSANQEVSRAAAARPARSIGWRRLLPLFLLVVAIVNFSLFFPVNRLAADHHFPFFAFVFWYSFGAGVILFIVAAIRRELPRLTKRRLIAYAVSSFLGFAAPFSLLAFVAAKLPSGISVLLVILTPVFTYLFSLLACTERLHWMSIGGLVLGIIGILFVVVPSGSLPEANMVGWALISLLAPACFAALNVFTELYHPPETPPFALSSGVLLTGALMLLPLMLATGQFYIFPGPDLDADLALAAAVVINLLMWPIFYTLIKLTGAFQFSIMNIVAVVLGFVWSIVFFAEVHSHYVWLAMALMLAGVLLIVLRPRPAKNG